MTPRTIITQTACAYGLAPATLTGRDMTRRVAEARAVAAFLAYELTGASYAELGRELGRERSCVCRLIDRAFRSPRLSRVALGVERSIAAVHKQDVQGGRADVVGVAGEAPR